MWEDQSDAAYRILYTVLIKYLTVLYESYSTVMQLIGQIQYSYALNWENYSTLGQVQYSYAVNLFVECYVNNTL